MTYVREQSIKMNKERMHILYVYCSMLTAGCVAYPGGKVLQPPNHASRRNQRHRRILLKGQGVILDEPRQV